MALTLMYITNNPQVAEIAEKAGVDRIWIDMEYIGKEERQAGMNTVKSHHTVEDIKRLRPVVKKSKLMVRVNPIHEASKDYCSSKEEIDQVIEAGAEIINEYSKIRNISGDELNIIKIMLAFPQKLWRIANKYYNSRRAWCEKSCLLKLSEIKKESEKIENFLKDITF